LGVNVDCFGHCIGVSGMDAEEGRDENIIECESVIESVKNTPNPKSTTTKSNDESIFKTPLPIVESAKDVESPVPESSVPESSGNGKRILELNDEQEEIQSKRTKRSFELEYNSVVLDIEGTVTPVSFVHEILFPYVRNHLKPYLESNLVPENVSLLKLIANFKKEVEEIEELKEKLVIDLERNRIESELNRSETVKSIMECVKFMMDSDMKKPALKDLQAMVWKDGYESGKLKAPVYSDVSSALEIWKRMGVKILIYSSGAVDAQKLLFQNTESGGDLTPLIDGYYDTKIGQKKVKESYVALTLDAEIIPEKTLFVTDILDEAIAAKEAGLQVALSVRKGNAPLPETDFKMISSLMHILPPGIEFELNNS